jgi:predicted protein tyrosine phosphatase
VAVCTASMRYRTTQPPALIDTFCTRLRCRDDSTSQIPDDLAQSPLVQPFKCEGNFRRVLCVCSAGILRSATIAWVLSNEPYCCNTRAVGLGDYALIRVTPQLLQWADEIVCADKEQYDAITRMTDKPVHCLHIPDQYDFRSPELVSAIETALKLCDVFSSVPTEIKS